MVLQWHREPICTQPIHTHPANAPVLKLCTGYNIQYKYYVHDNDYSLIKCRCFIPLCSHCQALNITMYPVFQNYKGMPQHSSISKNRGSRGFSPGNFRTSETASGGF